MTYNPIRTLRWHAVDFYLPETKQMIVIGEARDGGLRQYNVVLPTSSTPGEIAWLLREMQKTILEILAR